MFIKTLDRLGFGQGIIKGQFFRSQPQRLTLGVGLGDVLCQLQQFLDDLLIRQHSIKVSVHHALDDLTEFFRLHHIGSAENGYLFRNQFLQQLNSQIRLLHIGHFFQELWVKQGKFRTYIGKQIDNPFTFDTVLQKFVDLCIDLRQCKFFARPAHGEPDNHCPDRLKKGAFQTGVLIHHAAAQREGLSEQQRLLDVNIMGFLFLWQFVFRNPFAQQEIDAAADGFSPLQICSRKKC